MGTILIEKLNPHPKNGYYFSDVEGEKYEEIKRSIHTYGIRDPIKVTTNYTIISGHQRYRIAKDLQFTEVPVEIVDKNEWEAEYLLIAENVERRGQAETDPIKKGRIAQFLKEYWGIQRGGDQKSEKSKRQNVHSISDIAESVGESVKQTQRLLKLNDLISPLQELVSAGKLGTTAAEQLAYLTEDEQQSILDTLGESISKITVQESKEIRSNPTQVQTIVNTIDNTDYNTIDKLKNELEKEKKDNKTLEQKLNNLELKKSEYEQKIKKIEDDINSEQAEIERLKRQKEKLELQAHISISELQIGIHKFIEDFAPSVFLQGAVASSTFMMRDDLLDSVIALEEFTKKLREMLYSKVEVNQNDVIDVKKLN